VTKLRTQVPADISAEMLFISDNTCCVCEERGKAVQIHHLDENPDNHEVANLAVLCLECHNQTQVRGGFGRKLSQEVVARYRREWIARVADRRRHADQLTVQRTAGPSVAARADAVCPVPAKAKGPSKPNAHEYINSLPSLRAELLARAQPEWDTGITSRMVQASYDYIDALAAILVNLAGYYPEGHFWEKDPHEFFSEQIASRFAWHRAHAEPRGPGTGGTIVNVVCCGNVQADVAKMVEDMALSIVGYDEKFDWKQWPQRWNDNAT
jgi:hypothetical protein